MPECTSKGADEPLRLTLTNSTLDQGKAYTFGVGVVNPGAKPEASGNLFGITLKDSEEATVDANMKIPGLTLKSEPFQVGIMGWSSAEPDKSARVLVEILVLHTIPAERVAEIVIVSPEGVMYHDPSSGGVQIAPELPLVDNAKFSIAGNHMVIKLNKQESIVPGRYQIKFQVKNPNTLPNDNTWTVEVRKDQQEIRFSHVIAGYNYGERSPEELLAPVETSLAMKTASGTLSLAFFLFWEIARILS